MMKHHFSSGIYAREMTLAKDYYAETHSHKYDHLSILASGSVEVEVEGISTYYTAPTCIEIKAEVKHKITALSDVVWFCIHATDETDIEHLDEVLIKE
jgi:quercetin dioxygenase-like cupin family protein